MTKELHVPYGAEPTGKLISGKSAVRGVDYICPGCGHKLVLKTGPVKVRHFAHASNGACSYESLLHKTAKALIVQVITENAGANGTPGKLNLSNACTDCACPKTTRLPAKTFSSAKQEVGVNGFVCDVVGYRGSQIALAIEIVHTHKVTEVKALALQVYWAELNAIDVVENPYVWNPIRANLKPYRCSRCEGIRIRNFEDIKRQKNRLAKNPNRPLEHLEEAVQKVTREVH